ncbi:bifunctional Lipin [Babesia duncani]|uniref:phosphatidate phosphatase n=1 Tax=Babesia duncani TaxID=323732 RepID=A0AAD9PPK1_9APIC|nr:bifunctional Lipin [Babesia duncani]
MVNVVVEIVVILICQSINMWEKLCSSVVRVLDFNQATLSGSIDIICVRHREVVEDGEGSASDCNASGGPKERWVYRSTPFHVRFGKAKLLKSREKTVSIYVNGELSNLTMKLGAAGEAFFGGGSEADGSSGDELDGADSPVDFLSDVGSEGANEACKPSEMVDYGYYACNSKGKSICCDTNAKSEKSASMDIQKTVSNDCSIKKSSSADDSWSWKWDEIPTGEKQIDPDAEDKILQFSLCGHLLSSQDEHLNAELFRSNLVDWERLDDNPSLWYHPSLVARFDKRPPYYQSKIALPLLASWIVFNRPLSVGAIERLLKMSIETHVPASDVNRSNMHLGGIRKKTSSESSIRRHRLRMPLRPTSKQLESLNLKMGPNRITFTVTSALQGSKSVHATLYLWPSDVKIVISDVDGTITRSDALGHIMPILGRDWSHVGVAQLFTKIRANGYQVVYLTARAIGQADYTREYLFGLTQNDKAKLPQGPLFLSPDRLLPSFKREVITKSAYMFKIPALRDIRNLFPPDHNPFYAGFGNNESDHRAYVSVGMPESRVFIINSSGIIRHVNSAYAKTYESMSEIAEHMFPPCNVNKSDDETFNSFQYWNFPLHLDVADNPDGRGPN